MIGYMTGQSDEGLNREAEACFVTCVKNDGFREKSKIWWQGSCRNQQIRRNTREEMDLLELMGIGEDFVPSMDEEKALVYTEGSNRIPI